MTVDSAYDLIPELCKQFYGLGWVTGTGGGMSIRQEYFFSRFNSSDLVYIAPSGVQKERMKPEDLFVLDFNTKEILKKPMNSSYKMSQCTPLFWCCYTLRPSTRACIHTHSINALLVTLLKDNCDYVELTHLEMIKGIKKGESSENFKYYDRLIIPIIDNTAEEEDLKDSLAAAILKYPETNAVLVRRHGVYVWGSSWEKAKSMAECYDYLFECYVQMHKLGFDAAIEPCLKKAC
jgi:methylthioribulose-1-phosphate dehydratase